ncbi:putative metalloprotease CJM1_0395 family protein [Imhoffiella purpurea]|uniref:SrpA-related protein n=1 Tax=Imhoffiella purpurea TaxID=1249627 RepID=W9VBA5_9GAMM|nr:putative metalloprotease CJM1_0395 family protein [Imhoffiella purpurea]EXJ16853.1 hypothetical protein D779_2464 [Imhoffiella purpurea]
MEIHSAFTAPFHTAYRPDTQVSDVARRDTLSSESNRAADTAVSPSGETEGNAAVNDEALGAEGAGSERSDSDRAEPDLTEEELQEIELLKARDAEVRAHEQAHMAAGGGYVTGGASYSYQTGPDGQRYAIGGEVGIDTSMSSDAAANLQKARTIIRAALAPAEPSAQDFSVAASARAMEMDALGDLREERLEEQKLAAEEAVSDAQSRVLDGSSVGVDASGSLSVEGTNEASYPPDASRRRLEARISAFFAPPREEGLSQFA